MGMQATVPGVAAALTPTHTGDIFPSCLVVAAMSWLL
jgi:hypothetical protein